MRIRAAREVRPGELGLTQAVHSVAAVTAVLTAKRVIRRVGLARVVPVFASIALAGTLAVVTTRSRAVFA